MTRFLALLILALLPATPLFAWNGLTVGTGGRASASHDLVEELDRFFRHRAPELGTALVPRPSLDFAERARELAAGRLDLAILPLGLVETGQSKVKVLAYLWEVVLVPFAPHAGDQPVGLDDPLWGLENGAVLAQAGLENTQLVDSASFAEAFLDGEPGVFLAEVVGHPRILRGFLGAEIHPRDLSPALSQKLQSKLPWLNASTFRYQHNHRSLGYPMVLAARTDLDLETLGKLFGLLRNLPQDLWPDPYITGHLAVKRTSSLPPSMRHPAQDWKPEEAP